MSAAQKLKPAQPHELPPSKPDFAAERQVLESERQPQGEMAADLAHWSHERIDVGCYASYQTEQML